MAGGKRADAEDRDDELIREVRHAAGNLVQRMQYWTVLLEDEIPGDRASESLASLRQSLDSLHRLVVRSLDLHRSTETRPVAMPLGDVITAFALRFGGNASAGVSLALDSARGDIAVDPFLLERALALLSEAFGAPDDTTNDRASISVEQNAELAAATLCLRAAWRDFGGDPFAPVQARVALALALKLLQSADFDTEVEERDDEVVLRIVISLDRGATRDDSFYAQHALA